MLQMGLFTSALSYTIARNFYRSYISFVIRSLLFWIDYAGLTRTLNNNNFGDDAKFMRKVPGGNQKDSLVLLPAFCLLDKSLDPISRSHLSRQEQSLLINTGILHATGFQTRIIGSIGGIAFGGAVLYWISQWVRRCMQKDKLKGKQLQTKKKRTKWITIPWLLFRSGSWIVCTAFIIWNWIAIAHLRSWVNGSVWLGLGPGHDGANPENTILSIGQLTPLVALGTIVLTFTNSVCEYVRAKKREADDGYTELQDRTYSWKTGV